jgi:predicted nucleic acid-binding protein
LIEENQAVWCDMVRLELWRGAGSASDRGLLRDYEADVPTLEINREVWDKSCALAQLCCSKGRPLPATDLLIYACAIVHGVDLLHRDQHFDVLERLYPR